jgi:hypothetical protein
MQVGPSRSRIIRVSVNTMGYHLPLSRTDCPSPWPGITAASPISGDTGSDQAIAWVRHELDECMNQHSATIYQLDSYESTDQKTSNFMSRRTKPRNIYVLVIAGAHCPS